jgi:hypothetical protein
VLPVVVLLPLPAALTPLLCNHLPKSNHATESQAMFQRIRCRARERYLHHDLVAFSERIWASEAKRVSLLDINDERVGGVVTELLLRFHQMLAHQMLEHYSHWDVGTAL